MIFIFLALPLYHCNSHNVRFASIFHKSDKYQNSLAYILYTYIENNKKEKLLQFCKTLNWQTVTIQFDKGQDFGAFH